MVFYSLPPKVTPVPNCIFDEIDDPDTIRNIALEIEEALGSHSEVYFPRPSLLLIRSMLLDYADRIDREGYLRK